ncbi:MAG: substrate-binding domain-containing protein, partial [Anaerolineae bacterium]|nr:substrate-binding domain-containing protein [Anaerolineae bacterium]
MNRSRLVFLIIVGAALLIVGGGVLLDQMGTKLDSESDSGESSATDTTPIMLTVAASPIGVDWIEQAAQTYNGVRRRIEGRIVEVRVTQQDSLPVWNSTGTWSIRDHPIVWIPETTAAVAYAGEVGLDFAIREASLASTVMIWGAPAERADVLINEYGQINWTSVQQASVDGAWSALGGNPAWGYVIPGFAQPSRYMSGIAALLIASAEFHDQAALDAGSLNDQALIDWLRPVFESVPNFATLGTYPAQAIATRGTSAADIALLPESEWLANYQGLTTKVGALTFVYPAYQVWLDFPFAVWDGPATTETERAAADDFLAFLR